MVEQESFCPGRLVRLTSSQEYFTKVISFRDFFYLLRQDGSIWRLGTDQSLLMVYDGSRKDLVDFSSLQVVYSPDKFWFVSTDGMVHLEVDESRSLRGFITPASWNTQATPVVPPPDYFTLTNPCHSQEVNWIGKFVFVVVFDSTNPRLPEVYRIPQETGVWTKVEGLGKGVYPAAFVEVASDWHALFHNSFTEELWVVKLDS